MSTRPQFSPTPVFNATTSQDMSGDLTSLVTIIQKLSMVSYGISWAGSTPIGAISLQVSNDYSINPDGSVNNAGTWNTATINYNGAAVTSVPVTGNTGNGFIDVDQTAAYAIRLLYTSTSGTGSLSAVINAKVA